MKSKNLKKNYFYNLKKEPSKYYELSRKINFLTKGFDTIKIVFLSNFTLELLDPFIKVELAKRNFKSNIFFEPYDQIEQTIHNLNSQIYKKTDAIVIALKIENFFPNIFNEIYSVSKINNRINETKKRIFKIISQIRKNNSYSRIILFNFSFVENDIQGLNSASSKINLNYLLQEVNLYLATLTKKFNSLFIFDLNKVVKDVGLDIFFDKKLLFLSKMPFSIDGQIEVSESLSRFISATIKVPKKCLVLDADNTIWGGVVGEDNIDGIKLGEDFPGNIYKSFQRYILSLRKKGVLLAIASKNNESDVLNVFKNHQDCLLKKNHFSAIEINWNDKASNIKKIAKNLNIVLDSIVFFDDNPVERELVKTVLPDVNVIEVAKDPLLYEENIQNSEYFDHIFITDDDMKRPQMYAEDRKRKRILKKSSSIDNYIKSLKVVIQIGFINKDFIKRCSQLINKTNQFNLTVKRKSEGELNNFIKNGTIALWARVKDKFGDNGLVGVIIAVQKNNMNGWVIENFLLSCRVIGRNIENIFLYELVKELKKENKNKLIIGEYIKGDKNFIVKDFYKSQGFKKKGDNTWIKKIKDFREDKLKKFIKVVRK